MSKLSELKSFYTLDDAAQRLSEVFGEPVTVSDVLQFAVSERLPLAAQYLHQYAKLVAPYTSLWDWFGGGESDPTGTAFLRKTSSAPVRGAVTGSATLSEVIMTLNGVYRLLIHGPLVKSYVQHLLMGKDD